MSAKVLRRQAIESGADFSIRTAMCAAFRLKLLVEIAGKW